MIIFEQASFPGCAQALPDDKAVCRTALAQPGLLIISNVLKGIMKVELLLLVLVRFGEFWVLIMV